MVVDIEVDSSEFLQTSHAAETFHCVFSSSDSTSRWHSATIAKGSEGVDAQNARGNFDRICIGSGTDMCSACCAAFAHAAGPYGISGSGPIQKHVLEALCRKLVFPIRSHDPEAIPSIVLFRFRRLTAADALRVGSRSPVDFSCAHQDPNDPRHFVGQG